MTDNEWMDRINKHDYDHLRMMADTKQKLIATEAELVEEKAMRIRKAFCAGISQHFDDVKNCGQIARDIVTLGADIESEISCLEETRKDIKKLEEEGAHKIP